MAGRAGLRFGTLPVPDVASDPYMPFGSSSQTRQPAETDYVDMFRQATQPAPAGSQQQIAPARPRVYFSESTGRLSTGGFTFEERNAADGLRSREYFTNSQVDVPPPTDAPDWRPLDQSEYEAYVNEIENPDLGTRFAEGFERGVRGSQVLVGAGLQFVGAEQLGSSIIEDAARGYEANAPYDLGPIEDIDSGEEAINWFVGAFGEGSVSILESVAVALGGAAIGTVAGGPLNGAALGAAGALGKQGFRQAVLEAVRARVRGAVLDNAQRATLRQAAALTASVANNVRTGVSDIYNAEREAGAAPDDMMARLIAVAGSIPYAAMETLPEYLAGTLLLRRATFGRGPVSGAITGFAGGAALEGVTEAGQEGLNIGAGSIYSGEPLMSDENASRILNAFAAGAAVGGPIGGIAGLTARRPADVLNGRRPATGGGTNPNRPSSFFDRLRNRTATAEEPAAAAQEDDVIYQPGPSRATPLAIGTPLFDTQTAPGQQEEMFNPAELGVTPPVVAPQTPFTNPSYRTTQGELFPEDYLGEVPQGELPLGPPVQYPGAAKMKKKAKAKKAAAAPQAAPTNDIPVSEPLSEEPRKPIGSDQETHLKKRDKFKGQELPLSEEGEQAVDAFGAQSHNEWLRNFREGTPSEAEQPRMRERGGKLVDINKEWKDLDPAAQQDNRVAARVAYDAVKQYGDNTEAAADYVHRKWMERNASQRATQPALFEDYANLPEAEKAKDRNHVILMRELLNKAKPAQKPKGAGRAALTAKVRKEKAQAKAEPTPEVKTEPKEETKAEPKKPKKLKKDKPAPEPKTQADVDKLVSIYKNALDLGTYNGKEFTRAKALSSIAGHKTAKKFKPEQIAYMRAQIDEYTKEKAPSPEVTAKVEELKAAGTTDKKIRTQWNELADAVRTEIRGSAKEQKRIEEFAAFIKANPKEAAQIAKAKDQKSDVIRVYKAAKDIADDGKGEIEDLLTSILTDAAPNGGMEKAAVLKTVTGIQRRLDGAMRFRSVHVFSSVEEMIQAARTVIVEYTNGDKESLLDHWRRGAQKKGVSTEEYIYDMWVNFNAAVSPTIDALFVISNRIEDAQQLAEIMEHEWIVHKGLRVVFGNDLKAHHEFLNRFGKLKGVNERLLKFLARRPEYRNRTRLSQLEELFADRAESGPLALRKLLEGSDGPSNTDRQSLWNELVDAVMKWIRETFGDTRTDAEVVMDEVLAALRKRAILGLGTTTGRDLNNILVPYEEGTKSTRAMPDKDAKIKSGTVVDGVDRRGDKLEIIINPYKDKIFSMAFVPAKDKDSWWEYTLRYIIDADGNLFISRGGNVLHDDMARMLDKRGMKPKGYLFETSPGEGHGANVKTGTLNRTGDTIKSNHPAVFEQGMFGQTRAMPDKQTVEPATAKALIEEIHSRYAELDEMPTRWERDIQKTEAAKKVAGPGRPTGKDSDRLTEGSIRVYLSKAKNGIYGKRLQKLARQVPDGHRGHAGHIMKFIGEQMDLGITDPVAIHKNLEKAQKKASVEKLSTLDSVEQLQRRVIARRAAGTSRYKIVDTKGKTAEPMTADAVRATVDKYAAKFNKNAMITVIVTENTNSLKRDYQDIYENMEFTETEMRAMNAIMADDILIIFSNKTYSKAQVAKIIAHELVGHYGLTRAFGGTKNLQKVLYEIAEGNEDLLKAAQSIESTGRETRDKPADGTVSRAALEEAVADWFEEIEAKFITRLVAETKLLLNKFFDIDFHDIEILHLWKISRTYLKTDRRVYNGDFESVVRASKKVMSEEEKAAKANKDADDKAAKAERVNIMGSLAAITSGNSMMASDGTGTFNSWLEGVRASWSNGEIIQNLDAMRNQVISTLRDAAQKSPLLEQLAEVFADTAGRKLDLVTLMQDMREYTLQMSEFGGGGPTEAQLLEASDMLAASSLKRTHEFKEDENTTPLATKTKGGKFVFNDKAFKEYAEAGILAPEEFNAGIQTFYADGSKAWKYTPKGKITADSPEYRAYLENRKAINELAKQRLLDVIKGAGGMVDSQIDAIIDRLPTKREITLQDRRWFHSVTSEYLDRYFDKQKVSKTGNLKVDHDQVEAANEFLIDALKNLWIRNKKEEFIAKYDDANLKDIVDGIDDVRSLGIDKDTQIEILNAIQRRATDRAIVLNADKLARKTLAGSYVPFVREGKFQVRVVAVDDKGRRIALDDEIKSMLPYYKMDSMQEAIEYAEMLDKAFGEKLHDAYDADGVKVQVKFMSVREKATETAGLTERMSVEQFKEVAARLGINLKPDEIERIVVALTNASDRQRKSLERDRNPGWNRDMIKAISEWMERTAAASAKTANRHRLDNVLTDDKLIRGDKKKLDALQTAFNNAKNEAAKMLAETELLRYARMYSFSAPIEGGKDTFTITTRRGKRTFKLQGRGNEAAEMAKSLMLFYHKRVDIQEDVEDFLSSHGAPLKTLAVTLQLGGSVGAGIVNMFSLYTHLAPYLAGYNKKFGRGGGFGDVRVALEISKAVSQLKNAKFSERSYLEQLLKNKAMREATGLSEREVMALHEQTVKGQLQASQMKALLGSVRSKITGRLANEVIDKWMIFFSYTEQLNRRTAALVSYRLYSQRMLEAGIKESAFLDLNSDAYQAVAKEMRNTITYTQGEYSLWNRPQLFRGNILTHVFMYKMFPLNSLELIGQLPTSQAVKMLALLTLMAGLKGLPFAEDIMDMIDMIAQKMGIRQASIEAEIAQLADSIIPGSSPILLRGVLDQFFGGTFSTRLGLGDMIPFTGLGREGTDLGRELENGFGPVYSAVTGTAEYVGFAADLGLQYAGVKDRTSEVGDLIRRNPATGIRNLEGIMWMADGQITDRQGRVVDDEAIAQAALLRITGFYPTTATEQNDVVRLSRYIDEYAKRIGANYRNAWASAQRQGNRARMREIENDVREWNRRARAAGDEDYIIRDFSRNALRSAGERNRTTIERYQRTTNRPASENLARAYGLED